jgi:biopolymer transport protein ExbD
MRFYLRKRRQPPGVIIVALIDILIVLLIFLMVTTTFTQQPAVKLALPESTQAKKSGANETPPFVISIDAQGSLRVGPDAKPVTVDGLKAELAARIAKDPNLKVAVRADKASPWGQMVRVMDAAKESRIKENLSVFTKEAEKP